MKNYYFFFLALGFKCFKTRSSIDSRLDIDFILIIGGFVIFVQLKTWGATMKY